MALACSGVSLCSPSIAVLTLALGIGANTAIFRLVNTVLLARFRSPRPKSSSRVSVLAKDDSMQAFSYPNYKDFRDRNEVFSGFSSRASRR